MFEYIKKPERIEERSFEIISDLLGDNDKSGLRMDIIKRVIHTTADFEYIDILQFKVDVEVKLLEVFKKGCTIICDTNMIKSGINKRMARELSINIECFVDYPEVHAIAKEMGITRSMAAIYHSTSIAGDKVYIIGNAPTALYRIMELCKEGKLKPNAVVGVPVGFVGAEESKDALWNTQIPSIISKGRKGGSTIGVAIVNAVLKEAKKQLG